MSLKEDLFGLMKTPVGLYVPHAKQDTFHRAVSSYRYTYFLAGRQTGKSLAAAMEVVYALLVPHTDGRPHAISIVTDKLSFGEAIFEKVIFILQNTPDLRLRIRKMNHSAARMGVTMRNGASLRVKSSHNPTALAGDTDSLIVFDESGFVTDAAMSIARPTLAVREGGLIAIGTADVAGDSSWFLNGWKDFRAEGERFEAGEEPQGHSVGLHAASTDSPYFSAEELAEIEQRETRRMFRLLYLAEPEAAADDLVFDPEMIEEVTVLDTPARNKGGEYRMPSPAHIAGDGYQRRFVAGVDLARARDYTVVVVLDVTDSSQPAKLVRIDRFNQRQPGVIAGMVAGILSRYQAQAWVDTTGIGDVYFSMISQRYKNLRPYTFTSSSKAPLIENLVVKLEQGDLLLFPDANLQREFENFKVFQSPAGHIQYRAGGSNHDDIIIALALAAQGIRGGPIYNMAQPRIRSI